MISPLNQIRAGEADHSIVDLRARIDELDDELLSLLERRFALTDMVGTTKEAADCLAICPEREDKLVDRLSTRRIGLGGDEIAALWQTIMALSTERQKPHVLHLWAPEKQRPALIDAARKRFGPLVPIVWEASEQDALTAAGSGRAIAILPLAKEHAAPSALDLVAQLSLDDETISHAVAYGRLAPTDTRVWKRKARRQQPTYAAQDRPALTAEIAAIERAEPVVTPQSIDALSARLATVAEGDGLIVQMGDCAEPIDLDEAAIKARLDMLDDARTMLGKNAVAIGRIGGQWAKPRSAACELVDGRKLPAYRGDLINGSPASEQARRPDPERLHHAHAQACRVAGMIASRRDLYCSHEALHLDYEAAQQRQLPDGRRYATSAHSLWLGARTNDPAEAHAAFLAEIDNPLGIKVGPSMTPLRLQALLAMLDPDRSAGRITLISRMGADVAAERLPALIEASRAHPVLWLCDPMHGNTHQAAGRKTRAITDILAEIEATAHTLERHRVRLSGLHLETTPEPVDECVEQRGDLPGQVGYTSLCDPRLNAAQARSCLDLLVRLAG